jgi:hypothetical protein
MELRIHAIIELFIFLGLCFFLDAYSAIIVTAAHFVPTVDYAMLKLSVGRGVHRKLFHNIFAAAGVFLALSLLTTPTVAVLGFMNVLFHFALDLPGKGIAVFYPLSEYRLVYSKN